ncbi:hypothetical protein CEQ90_20210 [Lewinellaceae bacterium SD302]|nr:hypothetical protein CEQ90_20210 [Lewinellaceae bacterium SD302]
MTDYGRISKDNYHKPFTIQSRDEITESITRLSSADVNIILDFGNLLFRFPSSLIGPSPSTIGPKVIGSESEVSKYKLFCELLSCIEKYESINKIIEKYKDYKVVSLYLENRSKISHSDVQIIVEIEPVTTYSSFDEQFTFENQEVVDFLIRNKVSLLNAFREEESADLSEYDNYEIFPLHIADVGSSIYRENTGTLNYDLNYLKDYFKTIFSYEFANHSNGTLHLKTTFNKIRAGERMAFPSYILINNDQKIIKIQAKILSNDLDQEIIIKCA